MPQPLSSIAAARHAHDDGQSAGVNSMRQLVELRWIAVVGQLRTISLGHFGRDIALPLLPMLAVLAILAVFNLASMLRWRGRERVTNAALMFGLVVDVAALTVQLYLSGGITNPFAPLYLLQVGVAAVLLRGWSSWMIVGLTTACIVALALFPGPVNLPARGGRDMPDHYVLGLLLCFVLIATLLVGFVTRIGRIVRARDARLAALRQRAAEEEHIVRMGLLASGAAHELGTPLATMAVILGDWRHLPQFQSDPELLQDVSEMQAQVLRCKAIVSGILASAGETRAEAPRGTTLRAFLDGLVAEWQGSRVVRGFEYRDLVEDEFAIVSDAGLQQMLWNVLDNALEASRSRVTLEASTGDGQLLLRVADDGPGFAPAILERLGRPYNSSKDAPGRGLGLFLALNVARALGGTIVADNPPAGGATVTVTLPLRALSLEQDDDEH